MGYPTAKCIKLVAIVIFAIGLSACSEQKTTQEYIAASKVYVENLEYDAAIIEIKNAVRQAPKNGEVRYYLAQAYIGQGSYLNAEKELNKAVIFFSLLTQQVNGRRLKHEHCFHFFHPFNIMVSC